MKTSLHSFFAKTFFVIVLTLASASSFGQIFQFNFDNNTTVSVNNTLSGTPTFTKDGVDLVNYSNGACVGSSYNTDDWDDDDAFRFSYNATGYKDMVFSFCNKSSSTQLGTYIVRVSVNGTNWTTVKTTFTPGTNFSTVTTNEFPASTDNAPQVYVEILKTNNATNARIYYLDNAKMVGDPIPVITGLSATDVCSGTPFTITGSNFTGATSVTVNNTAITSFTVTSATSITATPTNANTSGLVKVSNVNGSSTSTDNLSISTSPTAVTATPSATSVCAGTAISLTGVATHNTPATVTVFNENFNNATNSWTTENNSTGSSATNRALAAWKLRPDGTTYSTSTTVTFHSNDDSQFYMSISDAAGENVHVSTSLRSPAFSTVGLSSASLSFYHYYRKYTNDNSSVVTAVSTNGTSWTTLGSYTNTAGDPDPFTVVNYALPAGFVNQPTVYVRFTYTADYGYYWALDNVSVKGAPTVPVTYSWTSNPAGFTSSLQNPTNVIPAANTTYTFTATNFNGCSTSATTALVTVNTPVTPTFAQVAAICNGGILSALPTTSNNGITGTWSPALNHAATTLYTFTPTAGQCATNATMTITVNSNVTPTFTQRAAICAGGTLSALPTTSNNGITGTWSPALNNGSTTVYTFTPTAGQCAATATMTITVNLNVIPTFTQVPGICAGSTLSALPATSNNGIAGTWSPALNNASTTVYTFTPTAGQCATTATMTITVTPAPIGGSISGSDTVCASSNGGTLTLSGQNGTIVKWQSATIADFSDAEDISNTTTALTYSNLASTTYYRAVLSNGVCSAVYSTVATITLGSVTVWDGTSWSNGDPISTSTIIFIGNYTSVGSLAGCTATVANNSAVIISAGDDITLNGSLTVSTGSSFTLSNNANLLQVTDVANSGNIIVKRNSSAILRQDYTMWSSPVSGQNLFSFSPLTVVTPTSRFYTYNTSNNFFESIVTPSAATFATAKGYLIRVRNTHSETTPTVWTGTFTGQPHNGPYTYTMDNFGVSGQVSYRYNLIGNPYPSPIDAIKFAQDNASNITGTLYFWRKTNNAAMPTYSSWSKAGYNPQNPASPRGTFVAAYPNIDNPEGMIQTGQGFFVEALGNATSVNFNNGQRINDHDNQFFRNAAITAVPSEYESHRIWLNVTNAAGAFCQAAVGYFTDATTGYDDAIDAKAINDGPIELYSKVDDSKLVIQARPVPFDATDIVPMGLKVTAAGNYTIGLDHFDGLFSESQDIFLKDNLSGTQQDLKAGPYAFTSDAGTFENRFEIVYQPALGTNNPILENAVVIYKQGDHFVINSGSITMDNVKVFDIRGRLLMDKKDINASEMTFNAGEANQVLIVKIISDANQSVTKKVVN